MNNEADSRPISLTVYHSGSCGNAKNCSYAFDRFGYGAVVCAGPSVTAAWKEVENADSKDYLSASVAAALRMKKNLGRYIVIL